MPRPPADLALSRPHRHHHHRSRKTPLHYLKPGALAQLRDAQRTARSSSSCCWPKKRSRLAQVGDAVDTQQTHQPAVMTPGPSLRVFGPVCPQRKKLLAPKTPSSPATVLVPASPRTPASEVVSVVSVSESVLEALPLELLVRIVCNLHHDQLKPAFHVSKRLRHAVMIARQSHFDFTTPDRERQQALRISTPVAELNWPFSRSNQAGEGPSRPPTPKAPRHAPKPPQARISLQEMQKLAGPLFHGSGGRLRRVKPPSLPRVALRAVASHRVLFYEEELCQAVAQNTI